MPSSCLPWLIGWVSAVVAMVSLARESRANTAGIRELVLIPKPCRIPQQNSWARWSSPAISKKVRIPRKAPILIEEGADACDDISPSPKAAGLVLKPAISALGPQAYDLCTWSSSLRFLHLVRKLAISALGPQACDLCTWSSVNWCARWRFTWRCVTPGTDHVQKDAGETQASH